MIPYDRQGDNSEMLKQIYQSSAHLKQDFDKWARKDWYGVAGKLQDILRLLMQTQEAQIMQEQRIVALEKANQPDKETGKKLSRPPGCH